MPIAKRIHIVLLLALLPVISNAEKVTVPFSTLKNELITCLETDKYGRTWIGTTKGIFQYDGTNLYKYNRQSNSSSPLKTLVESILTTSSGTIVASSSNGMFRYNADIDNFDEILYPGESIRLIDVHKDGNYMFYNSETNMVFIMDPMLSGMCGCLEMDADMHNIKYSRLSDGNYVYHSLNEFYMITPDLRQIGHGACEDTINSIIEMDGKILMNTTSGIEAYTYAGEKILSKDVVSEFCNGRKVLFLIYKNGHAYIGIDDDGIYDIEIDSQKIRFVTDIYRKGMMHKIVSALGVDESGYLWLKDNTSNLGCHIISTKTDFMDITECVDINNYPEDGSIVNIATDAEGRLYVLTEKTLYIFNEDLYQLQPIMKMPSRIYKDLAFDNFGHMFIIDNTGISVFETDGENADFIKHINAGGYWLSQNETLHDRIAFSLIGQILFIDKDLDVESFDMPGEPSIQYIYSRPDKKSLCISHTYDSSVILENNVPAYIDHPGRDYIITSSIIGRDGLIWQSTDGIGVLRINPATQSVDTLDMRMGLPDNMVYRLENDAEGNVWMITTNGVAKFEYSSGKIYNYNEINGKLFDLSYGKLVKSNTDDLYIFSSNHIFKINPTEETVPTAPKVPLITSVTVNSEDNHMYPQDLIFKPDENNISVNFVSVMSQNIWPVKYEYMLGGYDKSWHKTNIGSATYNNVPPGRYQLLVRATYIEEAVSDVCTLNIRIKPAFYQTWWFILLVIIVSGSLAFSLVYFFIKIKITVMQYKMRAEQEQMKVELYSNLSHTIKTPTSLIVAPFHELVDGREWSSYEKNLIDIIDKNIDHILNLTKQFLENWSGKEDFIMNNDRKLSLGSKDIVEIVRESVSLFRPSARRKNIELLLKIPESLTVMIDEEKIVKILYNLIHNAIKYTPENGHVEISVDYNEEHVILSVADSGVGISDDIKDKIFDRFFKVSSSEIEAAGFGLGLHHTRNLVHIHNGQINVHNNKPSGAIFKVTLPFIVGNTDLSSPFLVSDNLDADEWNNDLCDDQSVENDDSVQLLIVEDNEELLDYLNISLSRFYKVSTAHDGIEAIDQFAKKDIDIVITDVMMSNMDGLQLCKWIKENDEYCHLPVIILTAKSDRTDELDGIGAGADVYIKKPFDSSILTAVLENLLQNRKKVQDILVKSLRKEELSDEDMNKQEILVCERDIKFMKRFYEILDRHIDDEQFGINEICIEMGYGRSNLFKKLRALTGLTPKQFITDYKLSKAKELMQSGDYNISQIAHMLGFSSISTFSRRFHKIFGVSPTEYIKKM